MKFYFKNTSLFILVIFLFFQCSKEEGTNEPEPLGILIKATEGGNISLNNGISLSIPANALDKNTNIEVESLLGSAFDEFGIIGAKMKPDGLVFKSPAILHLPLPSDWDGNELPAIYEVSGNDPSDFILSGKQAKITGTEGAYIAEIEVNHFSALGAARNCHAGSINYLFRDFSYADCDLGKMEAEVKAIYGDRFAFEPYNKNGKNELFVTDVPIQCFLNTYFNDYKGFEDGEPITDNFLQTLRQFMAQESRQVAVGFNPKWVDANNDGIYEGFAHSAVLEIVGGQLKLRQSVSVNDKIIKQVIAQFGENNIYYPQSGELTAKLLNEYREKRSGELFEIENCGTPGCLWPSHPVQSRAVPYKAVRFYVSKYTAGLSPCKSSGIDFTKCEFRFEGGSSMETVTYFASGNTSTRQVDGVVFGANFTGAFAGNTFFGTRNEVTSTSTLTSSITVELNQNQDKVNKVDISYDFNGIFMNKTEFKAINIPFIPSGNEYRVKNAATCDHITLFTTLNKYTDREVSLKSFECEGGDFMYIYFYK